MAVRARGLIYLPLLYPICGAVETISPLVVPGI